MLTKEMTFQGGFSLQRGTIIYVRESEHGWWGSYYEPQGSAHSFALNEDQFSILTSADISAEELIWMPDPPDPPELVSKRQEMERLRLNARVRRHREEAAKLESLITEMRS